MPKRCAPSCWRLQPQQPLPACAPIAASPRDTSRDGPRRLKTAKQCYSNRGIGCCKERCLTVCRARRILCNRGAAPGDRRLVPLVSVIDKVSDEVRQLPTQTCRRPCQLG